MFSNWVYYGELMAIATALSWSIGIFPFTTAARYLGPNQVNHLRLLLAVIILSVVCMIAYNLSLTGLFYTPTFEHYLWYGLSGIVGLSLGDYFSFSSFAILGPKTASVFSTLAPGTALLFGYFMLGEKLNMVGVLGMIITVSGVLWLTISKSQHEDHRQDHGSIKTGIAHGIFSALCQGAGIVLAKKGTEELILSAVHATWIRMLIATIAMFMLTIIAGRLKYLVNKNNLNLRKGLLLMAAGTLFGPVIGVSLAMYSISIVDASVAQTIFSLVPVFVLPISYFVFREKLTWPSIAGAIIAIAGVLILIWRDKILETIIS